MILDPRGGPAGEIAQLAAPPPGSGTADRPSRAALRAAAGAIDRARQDWSRSVQAAAVVGRDRKLGSRDRRMASDLTWHVIRGQRLLGVLLGAPAGDAPSLDLVKAAAVLFADAPLDLATAGRDGLEDPKHTLLSLVLQGGVSDVVALGSAASLPDWFARELLAEHEPAIAVAIARSLLERAPLTLRVHRDRTTRDAALTELAAAGVVGSPSAVAADAITLQGRVNVNTLALVQRGDASVMDAGSQRIAELLAPQDGEQILDACAGAGGKTLALASLAAGARILGCDVRAPALEQAARRARAAHVSDRLRFVPIERSGPLPGPVTAPMPYDAVLIDAPCSGSGSLRREPHARWSRSPLEIDRFPTLQGSIADRFAPLLRPGGRLVYATCSLFRRENEQVVDDFLGRNPGFELSDQEPLRLRPDVQGCDGFFATVLLRSS